MSSANKRRKRAQDLVDAKAVYSTNLGAAYAADARDLLRLLPSKSVKAIITSPPYALHFKKAYGNPQQDAYLEWFLGFASEFHRVLRPNGSLVIEIGGAWIPGQPTRSTYHFELVVELVKRFRFHLAEEFFWFNRARMPSPEPTRSL
jgi:DNA modification methylase